MISEDIAIKAGDLYFSWYAFVTVPWSQDVGSGGPRLLEPFAVLVLYEENGRIECLADDQIQTIHVSTFRHMCQSNIDDDDSGSSINPCK